jgi:hypothetical protein
VARLRWSCGGQASGEWRVEEGDIAIRGAEGKGRRESERGIVTGRIIRAFVAKNAKRSFGSLSSLRMAIPHQIANLR